MRAIISLGIWKWGWFTSCLLYSHHLTHKSCVYSFLYNVHSLSFPSFHQTRRKDQLGNSLYLNCSRTFPDQYLTFLHSLTFGICCCHSLHLFGREIKHVLPTRLISLSSVSYRLVPTACNLDCNTGWPPDKIQSSMLCSCFNFFFKNITEKYLLESKGAISAHEESSGVA